MDVLGISKKDRIIQGDITLPLSKSISNRVLIIHALAGFNYSTEDISEADDTQLLINLLDQIRSIQDFKRIIRLDCNNAGTVFRFLTAYLANKPGRWLLTGSNRMKERPVGVLVEALQQLGARIHYQEKEGFPPLMIEGIKLYGGEIQMDAGISSQFVSALLLISPLLSGGIRIRLKQPVSSAPYINMTLGILRHYGIKINNEKDVIHIPEQGFQSNEVFKEHDWSSAAFWYAAVALAEKSRLTLKGFTKKSLQGDYFLTDIFSQLGVQSSFNEYGLTLTRDRIKPKLFEFDFSDHPGPLLPVIVACAGLRIPFRVSGLKNLRYKETDRLMAPRSELMKIGVHTKSDDNSNLSYAATSDQSTYPGQSSCKPILFNTYNDHRMAMAFSILSIIFGYIEIENPSVVGKSYPGFWNDLKNAGFLLKFEKR